MLVKEQLLELFKANGIPRLNSIAAGRALSSGREFYYIGTFFINKLSTRVKYYVFDRFQGIKNHAQKIQNCLANCFVYEGLRCSYKKSRNNLGVEKKTLKK